MDIIVQVTEGAVSIREVHGAIRAAMEPFEVRPLNPGTMDPVLSRYFAVDVPDASVPAMLKRLRAMLGVDAAYTKPPDALP